MRYTWTGTAQSSNDHRLKCFRNRIRPPTTLDIDRVDLNRFLNCVECDNWYNTTRFQKEYSPPFDFPQTFAQDVPMSIKWDFNYYHLMENQHLQNFELDPECGVDGKWMRLFMSRSYKWVHCVVRLLVWQQFYDIACENKDLFCVLPYWCIDDDGDEDNNADPLSHKRSCIVMLEQNERHLTEFESLMNGIRFLDGGRCTYNRYAVEVKAVAMSDIYNSRTFMSTWRSVSLDVTKRKHVYIGKPMIPHCLHVMALFYDRGMQDITHLLKRKMDVKNFLYLKRYPDGTWTAPMAEVFPELMHHIAPTHPILELSTRVDSENYFYRGSRKQAFRLLARRLDRPTYNRLQLETGNLLMHKDWEFELSIANIKILDDIYLK